MAEITIPHLFSPRSYQLEVLKAKTRYKVVVFHRKAGKTVMAVNELIRQAFHNPRKVYWYVAPTYGMAKDIVWKDPDMLTKHLPREVIEKKNEVEMSVYLKNGSVIVFKGADNPDSLRGTNVYGMVLDEYGDMKTDVWDAVLRPTIEGTRGWAMFIGTPKGKNHFHNLFLRGQRETESQWKSWMLKASESGVIADDVLQDIKHETPEILFNQEYECEFLEGAGTVFRGIKECIKNTIADPIPGHEYVMGVDLGRTQDFTVLTVIDRMTNGVVAWDRFNQMDWTFQKAKLTALARKYAAHVVIDESGLGAPITEDLKRDGLSVDGVVYTAAKKKELIENLAIKIEQQQVYFPEIRELISELEAFTYEVTSLGNIRYNAPAGLHDDCVNSLALASLNLLERPDDILDLEYNENFQFTPDEY